MDREIIINVAKVKENVLSYFDLITILFSLDLSFEMRYKSWNLLCRFSVEHGNDLYRSNVNIPDLRGILIKYERWFTKGNGNNNRYKGVYSALLTALDNSLNVSIMSEGA